MTYVCASKTLIADIPDDVVFVVMAGNEKATAADVRIIGSFDSNFQALPEKDREILTDCLVVAADNFRSKLCELINQRRNPPVIPGITE